MKIGFVVFEGFTDLDFFLPWDLVNRVRLLKIHSDWHVFVLGNREFYNSATGLRLQVDKPFEFVSECDAVFFCSSSQIQTLIKDEKIMSSFKLKSTQVLGAIDSGSLVLGALGLLQNKCATTYPKWFKELELMGAQVKSSPFVVAGNIATGARCLSGDKVALWLIKKLIGPEATAQVYDSVKPLN